MKMEEEPSPLFSLFENGGDTEEGVRNDIINYATRKYILKPYKETKI